MISIVILLIAMLSLAKAFKQLASKMQFRTVVNMVSFINKKMNLADVVGRYYILQLMFTLSILQVAKEGDAIPNVVFKARVRDEKIGGSNPFTWKDVSTNDLFKGKRAVVFALPGAFTPTCSSTHLPGYEKRYGKLTYITTSIQLDITLTCI